MDFPRYVFTSPGSEKIQGGSYGTRLVQNAVEYEAALKAGFFSTMPEALEKRDIVSEEVPNPKVVIEQSETPRRGRPRSE